MTPVVLAASSHLVHHLAGVWPLTFDAAHEQLRERLDGHELFVLGEVDTTSVVARAGMAVPRIMQVLTFHPGFMRRILEADVAAIVEAPLKFTLIERDEGIEVRCADPAVSYGAYPDLRELAGELHLIAVEVIGADQR